MAQFPSEAIAQLSYDFRTLGLGYANLGAMLMRMGIPYDSPEGTQWCAALTAILTGDAYATSAEMAREIGPFPGYTKNREAMLRVMRNHRRAAYNAPAAEYEGLTIAPVGLDATACPGRIGRGRPRGWDRALDLGEQHGFRNAQVTVLAPTGTIGLLMDCDTTGVEPDFALVKFKKLAGGGYFKIINQNRAPPCASWATRRQQIEDIERLLPGGLTRAARITPTRRPTASTRTIERIEATAALGAFDLSMVFNRWTSATSPDLIDQHHRLRPQEPLDAKTSTC